MEHYDTYKTERDFIVFLLQYAIMKDLYKNSSVSIENIKEILDKNTFSTQPNAEDWSKALSSFHEMGALDNVHPIFNLHAILQELVNEISVQRNVILNTIKEDTPKKQGLDYRDAQGDLRIALGTVSGYEPRESVYLSHQTTTYGLLQKVHTTFQIGFRKRI